MKGWRIFNIVMMSLSGALFAADLILLIFNPWEGHPGNVTALVAFALIFVFYLVKLKNTEQN